MTEYKQLTPNLAVRPQLEPAEIGELAEQGYKGIINARPDDEEPGQPKSAELAAEAKRQGVVGRRLGERDAAAHDVEHRVGEVAGGARAVGGLLKPVRLRH